jgi:hypothetical protein
LSHGARVALSEFIYEADGASRSALFTATRGAFAFVGGQLANSGLLTVDTPFGSIRSRTSGFGFGMLSLAALTFAMLDQAHAADPNVTLLDDDTVTYKQFDHGVFELITKDPIPRHIIVDDPGETIVLTKVGSSISINQVANSATRMEELQKAQQDALANYEKGFEHTGSSAYPFLTPEELLQPINFVEPASGTTQGSLTPFTPAIFKVPEILITPPTLAIVSVGGQIGVAATDIINASEANAGVEITGITSGVQNGRVVTVTIADSSNHVVYSSTTTVSNNTWLINLTPAEAKSLADGMFTLTADVSNAAGDPANASRMIRVDETPPTVTIDTVVHNNVVNVSAASTGFAIAGTTYDAESGQPVTVKIVDSSGHVVDTFTTAMTNNAWSVSLSPAQAKMLHDGTYTVTADVSDTAGNQAQEATQAIVVDETPPTVTWRPQAESGVEGTTIALGAITATTNSIPGHSNGVQSLVVSGIPVGAVLTDCTNSFTATSGDTSIDVKSWNLSNLKIIPPNDTNFTLTVTATDQDANTASASELVKVAPAAPDLNPVTACGNEDTAIALDLGVTVKSLSGANGDASPNSLNTLVVKDIPVGATLSDGTGLPGHSFTATADNTSYDVAKWNLSCLKITPPAGFEGCFTLTIAATERDSDGDISATATACEVVKVAPVADPPTASAPSTATTAENTAIDISGVVVGPAAEDADDTVSVLLTVAHGALAVCPVAGVTETVNCPGSLTVSGTASEVNAALASLVYVPDSCFAGCDTLNVSVTSRDGSDTYPTQATAETAIRVIPDSESLIIGGPGPALDWNDPANWSAGIVPTLSIAATIDAPCNYTVVITGTPDAQAKSLTIPHDAAPTDICIEGSLKLAGDLDVSYSAKLENDGILEETANATFVGPITNNGTIMVDPNVDQGVTGTITGIGKFLIDCGATLEFACGSQVAPCTTDSQIISFAQGAGKLVIDDWVKFAGVITGTDTDTHLTPTDLIDLTQLPYVKGCMSVAVSYNSGTNISTMTFSDGICANNVTLHLSGNYIGSTWFFRCVKGGAGTEVYDPPPNSSTVPNLSAAPLAEAKFVFDQAPASNAPDPTTIANGAVTPTSVDSHVLTNDAGPGIEPTALAHAVFGSAAAGILGQQDSFHFRDNISGTTGSAVIDLPELNHVPAISHAESAAGGPLAMLAQVHTIELPPPGHDSAVPFDIVANPVGGVVHVSHDLVV